MVTWLGVTLLDIGHARAALTAWTNAPGNPKPLPSYGLTFPSLSWTQEDGILLHTFAVWWNGSGYTPQVPLGKGSPAQAELTDAHLSALDKWAAGAVPLPPAVDVPASKALLVLWAKTDGAGLAPADYGLQPADLAPSWSARDATALVAFAKWANAAGASPALTEVGILNTDKSIALKQWFIERSSKIPGGWVAPQAKPPVQKPLPAPGPNADKPQPAPAPTALATKSDSTALYVLGGVLVAVVGGLWVWMARTPRAAVPPGPQENPSSMSAMFSAPKTKRERRWKLLDWAEKRDVSGRPLAYLQRAYAILDDWHDERRVSEREYVELESMLAQFGVRRVRVLGSKKAS